MEFVNPFPTALWRKRKVSRSTWRVAHSKRQTRHHGGRGKIYGLKAGKQKTYKRSSVL